MPKSIGKRWVAILIAVLLLVVSAVTMAFFTDRVDHSMQFTTASFSADGYTLKRTAPEGPFCAGEDVTATLKESNTGEDAINSVISMKATWVSPDTALSIFGNANAADNAKLSIDGTDISYKVSTDKKSITFDLPAHVLTAGTKDKARDLTLTIPASFKSTGRIEFTFEKVVVAQDGGGFSETYDRTQLNASKELDYSVRVGWAASSIEAQNGKALMGYLTEKDAVSGKFGIQFEYAFNYNTSPMKDFASKTDAKWSYYKDKADRLTFVEGMTSIGDYAFPDFELVTSLSLPESLVSVGKWSFDNISIPTLTLPAALTNFDTMSFGHINELTEITFNQAAKTDISFPTAGSTTGAFYVDPYVPTKIVGENPIAQGYDWITDQRRVAPVIRSYNYTWSGDRMSQPLDATTLTPDDDSNVDFHTAENRAKIKSVVFQDASGYYAIPDMKPGDAGGLVEKNNNMWDVSAAQNKSVIAWLKDDGTLIIAGDGVKVMANADSDWLFGDMANIETIDATLYDTSNATTMEYWHAFAEPDLRQNEGDWSGDPLPMEVPQRGTKQIVGIQDWDVSKVTSTMDMFYNANRLTSLNLGSWNTKSLKTPNGMFHGCSALTTLDVSGWNTSNVTTLQSIFSHCRGLTALDVAGWDVQKVTDMSFAFSDCGAPVLDLHTWKTNSLTTLEKAFAGAGANTINVTGWNTSKVITMDSAFENTASLGSLDLSTWDTSGVGRGTESDGTVFGTGAFNNMFFRSGAKSINVSGFDFSSLYGPKGNWNGGLYKMFGECKSLTEIVGAETWTNTGKIVELNSTFIDCEKLVTLNVSKWDTSGVTAMSNAFNGCKSLAELDVSKWNVSSCEGYINTFKDCESVKVLDISKWDMTKATPSASQNMFNGCKSLESLTFPTSVNWLATRMAANCPKLTTIEFLSTDASISQRPTAGASLGAFYVAPDAGVTVPVTTFIITHGSGMAQLKDASIYNLADDNRCLPLDLPVQSETLTYTGSEQSPTWKNYDSSKMTISGTTTAVNADTYTAKFTPKTGYAWGDGTTGAKSVTWKIGKAAGSLFVTPTEMTIALNDTTGTITVTRAGDGAITATSDKTSVATVEVNGNKITVTKKGAGTANITVKVAEGTNHKAPAGKTVVVTCKTTPELNAKNTWYTGSTAKSAITEIELKDSYTATGNEIESWDASAAQNKTVMAYVVEGTNGKKLILAGNGSGKIVANADSTSAFNGFTALTAFTGLNKLDTSNVTNMQTMFNNLDNIQTLDLSSFNTSKVTNFYSIFGGNDKLTTLNLTGWDTSAAKDMGQMFYVCNALTTINGLSSFNTANVTDMSGMFHGCKAMTSLDLSNFNTAKVKTLSMMFYQCSNLETVKLTSFDTSNVTNLYAMFQYCYKLKAADLTSFNTAKVTNMRSMFGSCKAVESLDLSSFDTSAVTNMSAAFDGCQTLQTVTLGKDFKFVGTDGYLPAPSATYISGADGNWYVAGTDTGYTPTELAAVTRVRNVTYSAVKPEIGGLDVGESVFLNVDGKRMEFIVVNQGNPDTSIYDDSCNGTWLLMKDIYEKRQWQSSNVNDYANSTIHSYLNSTYLNLFDANIRDAIKQVKLPYRKNGGSGGTDQSGANGLPAKIFLLSGYEVGWTTSDSSYFPVDGAKLDYFTASSDGNSKRIANFNGSAANWWLRSPKTNRNGSVWFIYPSGNRGDGDALSPYGIRPALVLPSTITVDNDRNVGGSTGGGGGDIPADLNLAVPEQVGTLTANGSEQSPTWKNYDSSKMTISGTTSAVKAGTYTATFTLNDGYAWFDGTAEDKDVQWTMESGAPMLAEDSSWYKSSVSRKKFTKIELIDSGTPSGTIVEQWNADVDNSGSIKAYITGSSGDYTLTIAGNGSGSIMANPSSGYLFGGDHELEGIRFAVVKDIAGLELLDTSKVTNMRYMFNGCSALTSLDLSGFDTSKVTYMDNMFTGCSALTTLDVSGFDTSRVTDMGSMFYGCSVLTSLDLSGFDTSQVTNMSSMFEYCTKLKSVTLGKDFKFVGTDGYLYTPSSTYISGADGKWYDTNTGTGYTPEALAAVERTEAVTYSAVPNAKILSGMWKFNVKPAECPGNFEGIYFTSNGVAYSMIGRYNFSSPGQEPCKYYTMWYAYAKTTKGENRVLYDYSWDSSAYRLISFSGPQVVTEEFYNWFVENAKPVVTLEGKWKFNETLTFDTEVQATEITYTMDGFTGVILETEYAESGKWPGWKLAVDYNVFSDMYVYGDTDSGLTPLGWRDESYRTIAFNGTQYVTKDFYDWFIANAKPWSEDESGAAEKIAVPKQSGTLTYNGSAQSPSWSSYDASKMTIGGTTTGTNAGSYTTTFALNDGFKWADGTTGTKSVIWKIGKATGSVSFSKDSLNIDKNSTTDTLDVTRTGTGAITATSSDTSVATVTVNGTKVTVTKVGDGTATITIKVAADANYKEASKTCSVTCVGIPTLAYGSTWYKGSTDKASITKIQIKDSYTPSGTAAESWNADARNSGSIKAYVEGTTLTIAGNGTGKIKANALSWSVFNGFSSATAITGLDLMDTSNALTMEAMFYGCKALTALDVSKFDTSNVTSMRAMFYECENLTSLNVSKFDTASVTNVEAMFQGCKALTAVGDVSGWNTAKVTSMYQVFYGCEKLAALDLSGWNTINVTNMQAMFLDCTSLTSVGDLSSWNTAKVTEMALLFGNCEKLASLDVSKFNTAAVTNMNAMFFNCSALTTLDVSSFDTAKTTNLAAMFSGCVSLTSLDVSKFNTAAVTNMNAMFFNCSALTTLDVSSFDTAKTTNLAAMFSGCVSLTSLDVSNWNTSNVTTMEATFQSCKKLTTMGDVSGWDTAKVTNMREMFCQCNLITSVDVTNWKTGNVTNMNGIFSNCEKLTSVGDLSGWDTSSATDMGLIFNSCFKLTGMGDISQWDTSNATKMNCLFATCESLTELDLSGWDTSKVTDMNNIFGGYEHEQLEEGEIAGECVLLRKITLGAKFKFVGTDSYLPEPDSRYISGADGKWYVGSTGYTPAELAGLNRTEAVTYVAVKGTKTMSILSGDNAVSGYSISE